MVAPTLDDDANACTNVLVMEYGEVYPTGRGQEVAEHEPDHCRNGHPLGPNQATVGYAPCDCGKGGNRGHRTWSCRTCRNVIVGDGCTKQR
jgi:hypothetical protein